MRSTSDQRREFNATMLLAMAVAGLLSLGVIGLLYGCMQNNQASGNKPHAAVEQYLVLNA
jgi:hypothetical protein